MKIVWLNLHGVPRIVKFIEKESRRIIARSWWKEGENRELMFNGHRVPVWDDEKVQVMDSGWLRVTQHWRSKWQTTPVSLPGKSMDRRTWWAIVHGVPKSWALFNFVLGRENICHLQFISSCCLGTSGLATCYPLTATWSYK